MSFPSGEFIRVSEAQKRYFSGSMSLRWWYKQVKIGALPHFRAGGAVLLRPLDVEAFVVALFRATPIVVPEQQPPVASVVVRRSRPDRGGLRFFPDTD